VRGTGSTARYVDGQALMSTLGWASSNAFISPQIRLTENHCSLRRAPAHTIATSKSDGEGWSGDRAER